MSARASHAGLPVSSEADPPPPVLRARSLYLGLALTTCSMLLVQQFLTRVFTIQFNSGLAFFAISTTFLGLGSAGVCVYALPRWFAAARIRALVPRLALGYALALVAGFVLMVAIDDASQGHTPTAPASLQSQVVRVIGASLLMLPALFLVGLVISLLIRAHASRVGRLYGADLVGGGIGCLLVLPLMNQVGGDHGIFVIAALASAGAALLAHAHSRRGVRRVAVLCTAALSLAPWFNRDLALVDVRSHRTPLSGVESWVREDREIRRTWNDQSRLGFFETHDGANIYVRLDSSCQTTIPSLAPEHRDAYLHRTDFERLPFVLGRHRRYLEIGAGGGRGMVLAKSAGAESITGVEINPGIVDATLGGFPGFGVAPLLADPRVRLERGEGRSWARAADERYDAITITFIQTGIASGSAAFALSEANLFTTEAFAEFLGLLAPDGLFYVYRHGGNEMLRLISMARGALASFGVTDIREHVFAARHPNNHALFLMSRGPFPAADVAKLDSACRDLDLEILYSPSLRDDPRPANPFPDSVRALRAEGRLEMAEVVRLYDEQAHDPRWQPLEATYVTTDDPDAFLDEYVVDVRAPTDDRPYFFFHGLGSWREYASYFDVAGVGILGGTVILLAWMAASFTALIAVLILLPLALRRSVGHVRSQGAAVVAYFSGLGFGYMAVQISFIQRFVLFLGHPVYAISVVLLAFLLASGLGSLCSDRLFRKRTLGFGRSIAALVVVLLAYDRLLPIVFHSDLLTWPVAAKIAVSIALILPLGFLMGLLFPQGIRVVDSKAASLTPWAWGANSAASVLGSIFALVLAIHFGFSVVAWIAAATYALCYVAIVSLRRSPAVPRNAKIEVLSRVA